MVLRRPERSVECSDSEKKMSACADQNHAPSLTCVRLEYEKYGIKKVSAVAPGGKERYESVWKALCILKERGQSGFVMIHDGARPFITDQFSLF